MWDVKHIDLKALTSATASKYIHRQTTRPEAEVAGERERWEMD